MKINNQPKARMHAARDSVDTGASQGARRATEDAPVSARPVSPGIDCEVVAIAKRRIRTNADKRRIVLGAAACTKPGEIGALMGREGVYPSALATWRRQYAAGELNAAESKRRGPRAAPAREELKQLALMTRERDKLRVQLSNAQLVIEVQEKVAALLEQPEPVTKFASP